MLTSIKICRCYKPVINLLKASLEVSLLNFRVGGWGDLLGIPEINKGRERKKVKG